MFNTKYPTAIILSLVFCASMAFLFQAPIALADSENLITNPSFVQSASSNMPLAWAKGGYGTNTATLTFPVPGYDGGNAARVEIINYISGDRKWYFDDVTVTPGHHFTFNNWSSANVSTELDIRYKKTDGTYIYQWLKTINPNNGWQQNNATFVIPNDVISMTIFQTIQSVGWLIVDEYSLVDNDINNTLPTYCGDSIMQSPNDAGQYEECDGSDGVGANQSCSAQCTLIDLAYCGNGTIDPGEQCEGNSNSTCTAPNGYNGTQTCNANSCVWNNCVTSEWCGDNIANGNEECDGSDGVGANQSCSAQCTLVNLTYCGDGTKQSPNDNGQYEECDGTDGVGANQSCSAQCVLVNLTPVTNLIPNPSFETSDANGLPQSWLSNKYGTNNAVFTYPVTGYEGTKAAMINITNYSSGDAKWMTALIQVKPNTKYNLSDHYLSTGTSDITLQYISASNVISYKWLADLPPAQQWTAFEKSFVTTTDAQFVRIFHVLKSNGSLTTDAYELVEDSIDSTFPQGMVSIDFDDGYLQAYQNGLPILDAKGFKATMYIITETMDGSFSNYIDSTEMLNAQSRGHEIGAHTQSHPHLLSLTTQQQINEISGSRQNLLNAGLSPISSFAYTYGEYDSNLVNLVQQIGFLNARTTDSGLNFRDTSPFLLKSTSLQSTTTFNQIKSMIDSAVQSHGWLILTFHDIRNDGQGGTYAVSTAIFQQVIDYLSTNNIKVVTNSQGINYLN